MTRFKQSILNQKGVGAILVVLAVLFIVIALVVMFFVINQEAQQQTSESTTSNEQSSGVVIPDEEVPLSICETGESEDCNDPVTDDVIEIEGDDFP